MNRTSRRSAAEAAEGLLEAGRTQPALKYDVELGLSRHHDWLRSGAPVPEWASASAGPAALSPVAIKIIVSAVLVGALGGASWYARDRPQPPAAAVQRSAPGADPRADVAPNARDVAAPETWQEAPPAPPPAQGLARAEPAQVVRAHAPDRRRARLRRAREASTPPARAASASPAQQAVAADATPAGVEPAASAGAEQLTATRATHNEVAPAKAHEPIGVARPVPPEPARPQAQAPDDLAEMQQVATAERLLQRSPARALALVRRGDARFASGYFQQERAYIGIMALIRLGRIDEARARAASFAERFPARPYGVRIRSALEAQRPQAR